MVAPFRTVDDQIAPKGFDGSATATEAVNETGYRPRWQWALRVRPGCDVPRGLALPQQAVLRAGLPFDVSARRSPRTRHCHGGGERDWLPASMAAPLPRRR